MKIAGRVEVAESRLEKSLVVVSPIAGQVLINCTDILCLYTHMRKYYFRIIRCAPKNQYFGREESMRLKRGMRLKVSCA